MKPATLLLQLAAAQAALAQSGPFRENNDDLKPLAGGAVEMYMNLTKWMPWYAGLSPGAIMKKTLPEGRIIKIVSNTATRKGALSTTSYMGPFTLVGKGVCLLLWYVSRTLMKWQQTRPLDTIFSEDPKGQSWMKRLNTGLCRNCTILTIKPRVVDKEFNPIGARQGVYVHHIQGRDLSKPGNSPAYQCAIDATGKMTRPSSLDDTLFDEPVMGADLFTWTNDLGETQVDLTPPSSTFVGGYHVGPKDEYSIQMDAVNYLNETRTLYVALEIEYLEGLVGDDVSQILLSVQGCEYGGETGTIKLSEKGVAETKSLRFPVRFDGKLVSASKMISSLLQMPLLTNSKSATFMTEEIVSSCS
jgi:hypothetical protein